MGDDDQVKDFYHVDGIVVNDNEKGGTRMSKIMRALAGCIAIIVIGGILDDAVIAGIPPLAADIAWGASTYFVCLTIQAGRTGG